MDGEERAGAGAAKNDTGRGHGARRPPGLTARQRVFINEYLIDLNATQAAIRAGYSGKTANEQAARLIAHVGVRTEIHDAMKARAERTCVDADRVVRELACLAFSDITDFVEWGPGGVTLKPSATLMPEKTPAIARVVATGNSVAIRLHNKVTALNTLACHLGIFDGPELVPRHAVEELLAELSTVLEEHLPPHQIERVFEELKQRLPGLLPPRPDSSVAAPLPSGDGEGIERSDDGTTG